MIESKIDDNINAKGFIFDGFPRTTAQAVALDDLLQKKGTGISGMLALEVNDEELVKRLLLRGQDSGRPDDRDENVIRRRIAVYNSETLVVKKFYNEQGKFHSINGIGTKEGIFKLLVDRITFLIAETDLTALETDLEHLDLTIKDFDVANDIAPELLLEIDAIKRAEAEEEEETREKRKLAKSKKPVAKVVKVVKKAAPAKKKNTKSAPKKVPAKNKSAKAPIKKTPKSPVKKSPVKKAVAKKPVKKTLVKAKAKKAVAKKTVKKVRVKTKKALKKRK